MAKLKTLPKPPKPAAVQGQLPATTNGDDHSEQLFAACVLLGAAGFAQRVSTQAPAAAPARNAAELESIHVQGSVYMLVGAGGNIAVQIGDDGVLVVDTGLAQNADRVIAAIKKLSNKPIRWVLNTHFHPDHTGGNEAVAKAGSKTSGGPAEILAHENVLTRMSAPANKIPTASWPTDTYFPRRRTSTSTAKPSCCFTTWPRTPTATRSSCCASPTSWSPATCS
jgi:hypothetical protein